MSTDENLQIMVSRDKGKTWNMWKADYSVEPPVTPPPVTSPPITDKKIGTIVPLYLRPDNAAWTQIAGIAHRYPRVHVVATINPNSGPGASKDSAYDNGINLLVNNGITVLGYVATGYGAKSEAAVKAEIDKYASWYPQVKGIFFDEMTNTPGKEQYYSNLDKYVKSKNMIFTVGNPGAPQIESYFRDTGIDNIHIYENQGLPSVSSLKQAWMSKYPRSRFGVIPYAVPSDITQARNFTSLVVGAEKIAGYVYVQHDRLPNPWDELSTMFETTVQELDRIAAQEGNTAPAPAPDTTVPPTKPVSKIIIQAISASGSQPNSTNTPDKAIDGKADTRWSAQGDSWLQADLGTLKSVRGVGVRWYRGDERKASFSVSVSKDGKAFSEALATRTSSGTSETNVEQYLFSNPQEARYVRLNCKGTNMNDWNSVTGFEVYGDNIAEPAPGSGNNPPTDVPPAAEGVDKFGVKMIYPTATSAGKSAPWHVNMANPEDTPNFRNLPTLTKESDGSFSASGGSKGQVRLEAWSETNKKWLNVEITGYSKLVSGSPTYAVQQYSRGGHHSSGNTASPCEGSAMKGRFYRDGRVAVTKEVNHPAYAGNRGVAQASTRALSNRWQGQKTVIYNYEEGGKTFVAVECWIDDDVTDSNGNLVIKNNWKRATIVRDTGGWSASDARTDCPRLNKDRTSGNRLKDEILNMPGGTATANLCAWRTDGSTNRWKFLSVREIVPPNPD